MRNFLLVVILVRADLSSVPFVLNMPSETPKVKTQQANSIFEFEGFVNDDDDDDVPERETAIDPIWEKQQKKVLKKILHYFLDIHSLV